MKSIFNLHPPREKFLEFVKESHKGQTRKYTDEPFWHHPMEVANLYSLKFGTGTRHLEIEICLGHDLIEDVPDVDENTIYDKCIEFGYTHREAGIITYGIDQLTDKAHLKEGAENLTRRERFFIELERLEMITKPLQNVKICDMLVNCWSIGAHDLNFAEVYFPEKLLTVEKLTDGDRELRTALSLFIKTKLSRIDV